MILEVSGFSTNNQQLKKVYEFRRLDHQRKRFMSLLGYEFRKYSFLKPTTDNQ